MAMIFKDIPVHLFEMANPFPSCMPQGKKSNSARLPEILPGCHARLDLLCIEGKDRKNRKKDDDGAAQCIKRIIRYSPRPAIPEGRILAYDKETGIVRQHYDGHADGERKEALQDRLQSCPGILKHMPGKGFVTVRHYGFHHQKCAGKPDRLNESLGKAGLRHRSRRRQRRDKEEGLHRASYRYLCIKTFRRDPLKCSCGTKMEWKSSSLPKKATPATREKAVNRPIKKMEEARSGKPKPVKPERQSLFGTPLLC